MKRIIYTLIISTVFLISCSGADVWDRVNDADTVSARSDGSEDSVYYINVLSANPSNGATDILVSADIEVFFDDNIDMSTVDTSTFRVNGGSVSGVFSWDSLLKKITFTPSSLLYEQVYTLEITTGIKNIAGDSLQDPFMSSFTTGLSCVPEIAVIQNEYSTEIFSGDSFNFGSTIPFAPKSYSFSLKNIGEENLSVDSLTLSGVNSNLFSVSIDPSPIAIVPGGSTSFSLLFNPDVIGSMTAQLSIVNNDGDENPFVISLTGDSVPVLQPEIHVMQGSVDMPLWAYFGFGTIMVGSSSVPIEFRIENRGSSDLEINNVYTLDPEIFIVNTASMNSVVAPGETTTFLVTFTPPKNGVHGSTLYIISNDADETEYPITINGRGVR